MEEGLGRLCWRLVCEWAAAVDHEGGGLLCVVLVCGAIPDIFVGR